MACGGAGGRRRRVQVRARSAAHSCQDRQMPWMAPQPSEPQAENVRPSDLPQDQPVRGFANAGRCQGMAAAGDAAVSVRAGAGEAAGRLHKDRPRGPCRDRMTLEATGESASPGRPGGLPGRRVRPGGARCGEDQRDAGCGRPVGQRAPGHHPAGAERMQGCAAAAARARGGERAGTPSERVAIPETPAAKQGRRGADGPAPPACASPDRSAAHAAARRGPGTTRSRSLAQTCAYDGFRVVP